MVRYTLRDRLEALKLKIIMLFRRMPKKLKCPLCGEWLDSLCFLNELSDFYYCRKCQIAYTRENLRPIAKVI